MTRATSRIVFKVWLADGLLREVETWAPTQADALPLVESFLALHWPGAKVVG